MSWIAVLAKLIAAFPELVKVYYDIRKHIEREAISRVHSNNARDIDRWLLDQSEPQQDSSTVIKGKRS